VSATWKAWKERLKPVLGRLFVGHLAAYPIMIAFSAALIIPVMLSFPPRHFAGMSDFAAAREIATLAIGRATPPYVLVHLLSIPWAFEAYLSGTAKVPPASTLKDAPASRYARLFWIGTAALGALGVLCTVILWLIFLASPTWAISHLNWLPAANRP
jgi:hypothetical protein